MALALENVVKRYGGRAVLDGISAEFRPGELTLILGGRGAGKTTLARAGAGQIPIDAGRIRRAGPPAPLIGAAWGFGLGGNVLRGLETRAASYGIERGGLVAGVAALLDEPRILLRPLERLGGLDRSLVLFAASWLIPAEIYIADGSLLPMEPAARERLAPLYEAARARAAVIWLTGGETQVRTFAPDRMSRLEAGRLRFDQ